MVIYFAGAYLLGFIGAGSRLVYEWGLPSDYEELCTVVGASVLWPTTLYLSIRERIENGKR